MLRTAFLILLTLSKTLLLEHRYTNEDTALRRAEDVSVVLMGLGSIGFHSLWHHGSLTSFGRGTWPFQTSLHWHKAQPNMPRRNSSLLICKKNVLS